MVVKESCGGEPSVDELVRSKGLKCVCQLCDCGRFHKHPGCKISLPTISKTFEENKNQPMVSDYKSRFQAYEMKPTHPVRHDNELRHPPQLLPMDFNTTKQTDYHRFENIEVPKPCKLQGEIDKLLGGEFHDETNYKDTYVGYTAAKTKTARPATVFTTSQSKQFPTESEYSKCFPKKEKIPQEKYTERPSHTYEILHPDHSKIPGNSLKNSVHDGKQGERARACNMRKPNIDFGLQGEFDHTTTNGIQFQHFDKQPAVRQKFKRKSERKLEQCKFDAISQNHSDFRYDENEARTARGKRITEPPSLIHLSMDMPHDFKTVSNMSYHNWKPESFRRSIADKPDSKYTPSADKFDHKSHTFHDYQSYGMRPRTEMIHPPKFQASEEKLSEDTSYKATYLNHGKPERKFYGEYRSSTLALPSPDKKFDASSTMRYDYVPMKIEQTRSFKPTYKPNTSGDRLATATEYNERYLPKAANTCQFSKYLEAAKIEKVR